MSLIIQLVQRLHIQTPLLVNGERIYIHPCNDGYVSVSRLQVKWRLGKDATIRLLQQPQTEFLVYPPHRYML